MKPPTFFGEATNSGNDTEIFFSQDKADGLNNQQDQVAPTFNININDLMKQMLDTTYLMVNIYSSGDVELIAQYQQGIQHTLKLSIKREDENMDDTVRMQTVFYKIHETEFVMSGTHATHRDDTIYQTAMRIVNQCTTHKVLNESSESVRLQHHNIDDDVKEVSLKMFCKRLTQLKAREIERADQKELPAMKILDQEHRDQYNFEKVPERRTGCMIF